MKITNEDNKIFSVHCGQKTGKKILVNGNYALMIFHSDNDIEKGGFVFHFTTIPLGTYNQNLSC